MSVAAGIAYRSERVAPSLVSISDEDSCACADCAALEALDHQRARFICRLKTRMLQLGGHLCDEFHPWGRCTCSGEGRCSWCESTCLGCGGVPHEGHCPELPDELAALPPICRLCYCSRDASCLVDGPDGTVVDCTYDHEIGACSGCLLETPIIRYEWQRRLIVMLRERKDRQR